MARNERVSVSFTKQELTQIGYAIDILMSDYSDDEDTLKEYQAMGGKLCKASVKILIREKQKGISHESYTTPEKKKQDGAKNP
jgi:hypothetical protein